MRLRLSVGTAFGSRLLVAAVVAGMALTSTPTSAQVPPPKPLPPQPGPPQPGAPQPAPPGTAPAQPAPPPTASTQPTIDCGAAVGARDTCAADTSSGVVLVGQEGEGNCALGKTWGFDAAGVWVADGCRGTFAFTDDRPKVSCSAAPGAAREVCSADTSGGVALITGSPSCVLGRSWGYDKDGVWVSDGCQASFVLTSRSSLSCGSDGTRQHCPSDTSAGVVLARATGTAACALGDTWGYDAAGVWVDKGCRADFVLGDPDPGGPENTKLESFFGMFEPYGRLRGHVAWFNDGVEVQDNASFLGMNFSTRGPVKFFATTEWGVSLVQGGQVFAPGAITDDGFPVLENPQSGQVFGNRLGNVGIDFGYAGKVTIGKQWAVHTDVTLYTTDQFVVFGSQASATYTAGTDGGSLGTGRADQTVTYRNTLFRVLRVGGQLQFRTADDSETIDGAGASAQLTIAPGVRLAAAYTRRLFADDVKGSIRGLGDDAEFAAVGARINWKLFDAAVVYVDQQNGDLARVVLPNDALESIAFDATGVEALLRFTFPRFSVYAGLNRYDPDSNDPLLDPNFRKEYGILGMLFGLMPNMFAYAEARVFDESVGPQGEDGYNVLTMGVHYGFSFKEFHRR